MPTRLGPVLSVAEFPRAELDAMRLLGEVVRFGDCAVPIDEAPTPRLRASVLLAELPPRVIADRHSAAWVWGALPDPPERHEGCTDIASRTRPAVDASFSIREVVIMDDEICRVGDLPVTSPLRTAIDLARVVTDWDDRHDRMTAELMVLGGFGAIDCAHAMERRRNLPNKRAASARLERASRILSRS
jgi:hypothetical protein